MNKKIVILCLLALFKLTSTSAFVAKDTSFWRTKGSLISFEEEDVEYGNAVVFEDNRFVNYKQNHREITRHKIVYIKTQDGLDANNKIVIQLPAGGTILDLHARSISKEGKVVELNKDNIKEMKEFHKGGNIKLFAIEGAEVGGQIEYTYTIKTPLYDSGKEILSMDYITKHATIIIKCYSGYNMGSKSFNWDTKEIKKGNKHTYEYFNVMPIAQEKYSTPYANRVAVEHKLKGSTYNRTTFSSYGNVLLYKKRQLLVHTPKQIKKAKSALKSFEGKSVLGESKLRQLTVFLKKKYSYVENFSKEEYEDVLQVMKSGVGNDRGLIKLYCLMLEVLNVDFEVLISCNKYYNWLDTKYCSRQTLTEYLIYFPQYKSYLYPASQMAHYGFVPSYLVGNKALIVSEDRVRAKFQRIMSNESGKNKTNLDIDVKLDLSENSSFFNIRAFGTGQIAMTYNSNIYYSESEEEIKKELKRFVSWRYPDAEILSSEMERPEDWGDIGKCDDYECKRSFKAKVKSSSFFDVAGDKLLLKAGSLIGPQSELYSEIDRVQKITNGYNKSYGFDIRISIPEGYKYGGEQNLNLNNVFEKDGKEVAAFKSSVTWTHEEITITIEEFYREVNLDKEFYEDFRRIINSAADFNKGVIMLEKI